MKKYALLFALIVIAAAANGIMDDLTFHFHDTVFANFNHQFWNPSISWENKNAFADNYILDALMRTVFVSFTDGWHLMKEIMISSLLMATVLMMYVITEKRIEWRTFASLFLGFRFAFALGFYLTYSII